eukprot:m.133319 g.133319  ORF g.133319 m.133319 type:complete len:124 (-) comp13943_c0_seq2:969-1340(-)
MRTIPLLCFHVTLHCAMFCQRDSRVGMLGLTRFLLTRLPPAFDVKLLLVAFEYREKSVDYGVEGESGGCVCVEAPVGKHLLLTYVCHVYLGECGHANLEYNGIHAISISFSPLTTMLLLLGLC